MCIVQCPTCNIYIEILELNCKIFRCGMYKNSFTQIPPHLEKSECEQLVLYDLIYGCGHPFKIVNGIPYVCDYI